MNEMGGEGGGGKKREWINIKNTQLLIAVDVPGVNRNFRFNWYVSNAIDMFEFISSIDSINTICTIAMNVFRTIIMLNWLVAGFFAFA